MKNRFTLTNTTALQFFQVMQFATAILIGILLVKSGMPTELVSVYEAWIFLASLFTFFWIVGGQNALLQCFPKLEAEQQGRALFSVFVLFLAASAAVGGLFYFTKNIVAQRLVSFPELPHLDLVAIFLVLNPVGFLIHIYYLLLKKSRAIVVFGMASFGLQLAVVVLPVYLGMTLREVVWGLVIWAAFKFAWAVVLLIRHARWRWDGRFTQAYLPLVWPLLLLAFLAKGSEYVSGLIVTQLFEDEKAFAVFRYGAREFPLAVLMVGALATSLIPVVSGDLAEGLARIKESTRRLSYWLYPLSMLSILAAPVLFPLFFNSDFKESARVFNIFALLLSSRIVMPQVVIMAHRKNYVLTVAAAVELLLMALLGWWWGRVLGLAGVALSVVAAYTVGQLILFGYVGKTLKIPSGRYVDWRTYLAWNSLLFGVFLVSWWI